MHHGIGQVVDEVPAEWHIDVFVEGWHLAASSLLSDNDLLDVREENVVLCDESFVEVWLLRPLALDELNDVPDERGARMLLVGIVGVEVLGVLRHAAVELLHDLVDLGDRVPGWLISVIAGELKEWLFLVRHLYSFDNMACEKLRSEGESWVSLEEFNNSLSNYLDSLDWSLLRVDLLERTQVSDDVANEWFQVSWSHAAWEWASW